MSTTAQLLLVAADDGRRRHQLIRDEHVIAVSVEPDDRLLLSVVEAAKRLGVGRSLMYELLQTGQIESIHIGRLRKVPVAALTAFVDQRRDQ